MAIKDLNTVTAVAVTTGVKLRPDVQTRQDLPQGLVQGTVTAVSIGQAVIDLVAEAALAGINVEEGTFAVYVCFGRKQ